ncbi:MAG: hypothetical protein JST26_09730 [Bacteroidetes bacterium]|nr:hypothetical protein [Bacteroidota bacterium]
MAYDVHKMRELNLSLFFSSKEEGGEKIEFDYALIQKHLPLSIQNKDYELISEPISSSLHALFSIWKMYDEKSKQKDKQLANEEIDKEEAVDNDGGEHFIPFTIGDPNYTSEKLHRYLFNVLPDDAMQTNPKLIGTLCKAAKEIGLHYHSVKVGEYLGEEHDDLRESAKASVTFIDILLEHYSKRNRTESATKVKNESNSYEIKNIVIHYGPYKQGKTIELPHEWFDALVDSFEKVLKITADFDVIDYLQKRRELYSNYLKFNSKSTTWTSNLITNYMLGLDEMLKEYGIKNFNLRCKVIGQLFTAIQLIPSKMKLDAATTSVSRTHRQAIADVIKQRIKRSKK